MPSKSRYLRLALAAALAVLVCKTSSAQVTEVGRPRIAIAPDGSFAIAQEILSGSWKIAVQKYTAAGAPIGPTNVFVGESCSGLDIWTSDFMENVELTFRPDGVLVVLMQHSGDLSFGGDQLISAEITIGAVNTDGSIIDLNNGPCLQHKVIFVGGGRQDRPRMALTPSSMLFLTADGFFNGANLRNVGIRILDSDLNQLVEQLIPHNDELSEQAFHMFPDVATNGTLVASTWQQCPIVDNAGNANECDIGIQFVQIGNDQLVAVGGNQVVNSGDPFGTVNIWPSVAMNGSGRSVVAWADTRTGNAGDIFGQIFDGGQKVGGNFQISSGQGEIYRRPEVAIKSNGGFMVVWEDSASAGFTARGREFGANGAALGATFELSPRASSQNGAPDVTTDGSRFLYTWVESSGGPLEVFSNAFTATADESDEVPVTHALELETYPNPFTNSLTAAFGLDRTERVTLDLYDVLGRHVVRLADETMSPGSHRLSAPVGDLPPGMYIVRLGIDDRQLTRAVVRSK